MNVLSIAAPLKDVCEFFGVFLVKKFKRA